MRASSAGCAAASPRPPTPWSRSGCAPAKSASTAAARAPASAFSGAIASAFRKWPRRRPPSVRSRRRGCPLRMPNRFARRCFTVTPKCWSSTSRRAWPSRAGPAPDATWTPCWTRCDTTHSIGPGWSTVSTRIPPAFSCSRETRPPPRRWPPPSVHATRASSIGRLSRASPSPAAGRVDLDLAKRPGRKGERTHVVDADGLRASTFYRVIDWAGEKAAWVAFEPITGRTHQIRAHAAALGTPVLGDGKYGGRGAFLAADGIAPKLHLHARAIRTPHPAGGTLEVVAPLPEHMRQTMRALGFDAGGADDAFANIGEAPRRTPPAGR